jgi:hypothetical protein
MVFSGQNGSHACVGQDNNTLLKVKYSLHFDKNDLHVTFKNQKLNVCSSEEEKEDVEVRRELKINRRKEPYEILFEEGSSSRSPELDRRRAESKPDEYGKTEY